MITRRQFISGVSSGALLLAVPTAPALGWLHGGNPQVGPPAAAKVQVGVTIDPTMFLNFMSSIQFVQSPGYAYPAVLNVDQYPTGTIGAQISGFINALPSNLATTDVLVLAWTGTASNGGSAALQLYSGQNFNVTAGSGFLVGGTTTALNVAGTSGYIECNFTTAPPTGVNGIGINFLNGATFTGFSGLIFCKKSDYNTIVNATTPLQLLNPVWVAAMKALVPKNVRTMAWVDPNDNNNFTQHRYRANWQTSLGYTNNRWIPNCWAGTVTGTGASGTPYICSAATDTPVSYTMGEVVQGQFTSAQGAGSLTINVGGRGAVGLFGLDGIALNGGSSYSIAAGDLCTLIYDDLLAGYLVTPGTTGDNPQSGMTANIPIEFHVALCNAVNCNLWYNFPPHITFGASPPFNSVQQIASYVASNLNSGLTGYFEWANEIWNGSNGFVATFWAGSCGVDLGFPSPGVDDQQATYSFYALRVAQIMPLVRTAWTAVRSASTLKCVSAFQAYGDALLTGGTNVYRLQGADLSTSLGYTKYNSYIGVNYNASPNRPVDVSDTLAYATYYCGAQCANFDANYSNPGGTGLTTGAPASGPGSTLNGLLGAADAYAAGGSTNIANAVAWLDWDINQGTLNGTPGGVPDQTLAQYLTGTGGLSKYANWETVAASYDGSRAAGKSILTIECYEGAMECQAPSTGECTTLGISTTYGGATGKIGNLLTAYKNSSTFNATVQRQFTQFMAAATNNRPYTPCWFLMTGGGTPNSGNQWAMYLGDVYTATWQSYAAVEAFD